jgi:hypothetical protein
MVGTKLFDVGAREPEFVKIKTVKIVEEIEPNWDWLWEGLVELPTECWMWKGRATVRTVRKTLRYLIGVKKEIVCKTKGCLNPKHGLKG